MNMGSWSGTKVTSAFGKLRLSRQFLLVAAVLLFVTMASLGSWVAGVIRTNGINVAADARARLIDAFLEPVIQDIPPEGIGAETEAALDALFAQDRFSEEVLSANLWRPDGTLLYTTNKAIPGRTLNPEYLAVTMAGGVVAEFMDPEWPGHDEDAELLNALIETYVPLHRTGSRDIVAIGEFHEPALELQEAFTYAQRQTWLHVGLTGLVTLGGLYFVVRRAESTIATQRQKLETSASVANRLAAQNDQLRRVAERSRSEVIEANEHYLTLIGSDIHDGPVQLLTLVMLNLSNLEPREGHLGAPALRVDQVMTITRDALLQLRNLSAGLVLPEIADLTLAEALELAALRHEAATGTRVSCNIAVLPADISMQIKICLYRVVQESLTNAFRHARGTGQELRVSATSTDILLAVINGAPAPREGDEGESRDRQGIIGMRNRVMALGGSLVVEFLDDNVRVLAKVPFDTMAAPRDSQRAFRSGGSPD